MSHTFTPESTKRNLSSSSSPNPNPRVFSPPSISAASESQREPTAPVSKHLDDKAAEDFNKPSPPIVINNVTNYSALKANLISLLGTDGFTVTVKGTSIHVKTRNCTDYYKLIDYCNDQDLEAHTWAPRHFRPIKVFIRHLHHTIAVEDIEKALTDEGFSVINVSNIYHRVSGRSRSSSLVTVDASISRSRVDHVWNCSGRASTPQGRVRVQRQAKMRKGLHHGRDPQKVTTDL
ncbi:hypothetical protein QTP88_011768 [Uroleucon formosanum]